MKTGVDVNPMAGGRCSSTLRDPCHCVIDTGIFVLGCVFIKLLYGDEERVKENTYRWVSV